MNSVTYRYIVRSVDHRKDILLLKLIPQTKGRTLLFKPGQYVTTGLRHGLRPTPVRCFSIVSTPTSHVLQVAMRIDGTFTQTAVALQSGDSVYVQGPFGDFTINEDYDHNIVMLASGIGITPFLSMLRDLTERASTVPVTLFFSNRSATNIPFQTQLQVLERRNPYIDVRFFTSETTGRITKDHLRTLAVNNNKHTTYFICGAKNFTERTQSALQAIGIHESRIISESFAQSGAVTTKTGISLPRLTYGLSAALLIIATGGVMLLDLHQNLPKLHAEAASSVQSTAPSSDTSSDSTTNNGSSTDQTTRPVSQNTNNSSGYTSYQQPISSVS
jgi:ferredoxin-NADP reductase